MWCGVGVFVGRVPNTVLEPQDVKRVIGAISSFTNPFGTDVNPSELYCLSSGVPAKPDVADDLLKAPGIGRRATEHFIKDRLVDKSSASCS